MRPRLTRITEKEKLGRYPAHPYVSSDGIKTEAEIAKEEKELEDLKKRIPEEAKNIKEETITDIPLPIDEHDVNAEDLLALGSKDLSMDGGDDEQLAQRITPVDFSGADLDVPGAELDDSSEVVGSEDEENNSYSLGGEDHQDLEETKP